MAIHRRHALATAVICVSLVPAIGGTAEADSPRTPWWPRPDYPRAGAVSRAVELARGTPFRASFAVMANGRAPTGYAEDETFSSASASKALLLAAELRRLDGGGQELDAGTAALLESMITVSDNAAAGTIYARVGDQGLAEIARSAGMEDLVAVPGYWGGVQLTAADLARFYFHLDRNLAGPNRRFGRHLLASVIPEQRWGIPAALGPGWTVWFKGGWRPPQTDETSGPVTHQAGLLRHRSGARLALAVMTDQAPGEATFTLIESIARELTAGTPPRPRHWPAL